jgi:hypothetical protein
MGATEEASMHELTRLTRALQRAAEAGDLAGLPALIRQREAILSAVRRAGADPGVCRALVAIDRETRARLEAEARRVAIELVQVRDAARALVHYILRLPGALGFCDYVR